MSGCRVDERPADRRALAAVEAGDRDLLDAHERAVAQPQRERAEHREQHGDGEDHARGAATNRTHRCGLRAGRAGPCLDPLASSPVSAPPLSELTTLRLGGPAARMTSADSEDELVDAVRGADAAGEPLLAAGGRLATSSSPTPASTARSCASRTRGVAALTTATGASARRRRGRAWDDLVARCVARRPRGGRVPVGHPRLDRRDADPERRRLRAGGLRDLESRARARPRERRDLRC